MRWVYLVLSLGDTPQDLASVNRLWLIAGGPGSIIVVLFIDRMTNYLSPAFLPRLSPATPGIIKTALPAPGQTVLAAGANAPRRHLGK